MEFSAKDVLLKSPYPSFGKGGVGISFFLRGTQGGVKAIIKQNFLNLLAMCLFISCGIIEVSMIYSFKEIFLILPQGDEYPLFILEKV